MIELTEQQWQEVSTSEPVIIDPNTHEEYVLVRRGAYDRLRALADDTVLATAEMVDRIMADDDANDPTLESYQSIKRKGQP
jgi:PHD/YefM family antitoxin component YafN of YafNO toxin-antitoxin module